MSLLSSRDALRPALAGIKGRLAASLLGSTPALFRFLRWIRPIFKLGSIVIVTRYDDVMEVFRNDADFDTPHKASFDVLTAGEPFLLGMRDTPEYRASLDAMHRVFRREDLAWLGDRAEALAEEIVVNAGGQIEVVDALVRKVTFDLFEQYTGIPQPSATNLDVWSTRLFEFLFANMPEDKALVREIEVLAPAFRAHIDAAILKRRQDGLQKDDVLGRCLRLQAEGDHLFTDLFIRTHLLGMLGGGPPQFPMVAPHIMEQLLQRQDAMRMARDAARQDDDAVLWTIIREALRFDPLAPALFRMAIADTTIAAGTARETRVRKGATILVAFASAMMDDTHVTHPQEFIPTRPDDHYVHFGHGAHECFGRFMNEAMLPRMLKPLLRRQGLRRVAGANGRLCKRGIFSQQLTVAFDD